MRRSVCDNHQSHVLIPPEVMTKPLIPHSVHTFVHVTNVVFRSGRKNTLVHDLVDGHPGGLKPIPKPVDPATTTVDIPPIFVLVNVV